MHPKIIEIRDFIKGKDYSLALRRITNVTIDTEDLSLFKKCLALHDLYEKEHKQDLYTNFAIESNNLLNDVAKKLPFHKTDAQVIISFSKLGKTYSKGGFAINNIDGTLHEGEIIGLVGENGNGKTTLLRMLGGSLLPSIGNISYHFTKAIKHSYQLNSDVVFVPQRIPSWQGKLYDNLLFTNSFYGRNGETNVLWAEMMLALLGLRPFRDMNWSQISSGYKTRFEIARVLLQKPRMLLLDEPLANLDIFAQQTILQDLKYRSQSITAPFGIFLSSQQLYEVEKVSDAVIFLKDGVPKYQKLSENEALVQVQSVFEIEGNIAKIALDNALEILNPTSIKYNGGVFVVVFDKTIGMNELLSVLAKSSLQILSIRDISRSSRRFFESL